MFMTVNWSVKNSVHTVADPWLLNTSSSSASPFSLGLVPSDPGSSGLLAPAPSTSSSDVEGLVRMTLGGLRSPCPLGWLGVASRSGDSWASAAMLDPVLLKESSAWDAPYSAEESARGSAGEAVAVLRAGSEEGCFSLFFSCFFSAEPSAEATGPFLYFFFSTSIFSPFCNKFYITKKNE